MFTVVIDNNVAGGETPEAPCTKCPKGTWSRGGGTGPCVSCGYGFTSPEGSWSENQCYESNACPAGTEYLKEFDFGDDLSVQDCVCKPGFGYEEGTNICRLCPIATFARGGAKEPCTKCPSGYTSDEGSTDSEDCRRIVCPVGQTAPDDAVSDKECHCYKGFGGG